MIKPNCSLISKYQPMNFQTSVVITAAEAVAGKTIFARFCSSVKALTISCPSV
jgi:hypothetical protein